MDKGKFYSGVAIMIGLIVLGCMLPRTVREFRSFDRTVSVKGLCEREVKADKAIWPLVFKTAGNDLSTVYAEIEAKNATIIRFLKEGKVSDEEISIAVPVVSDKFTQEFGDNSRTYRYVAKCTITVCTKDVDKVLSLMADQKALMRSGVALENDWENKTEFAFEGLNSIKPEMIEEATRNAREVAGKFASDSGSKLGKIKQANQGTFTISDRDSNTPYIKNVRVVTNVSYYLKK